MDFKNIIRAQVKLPCTVQLATSIYSRVAGYTEELARDSMLVLVCAMDAGPWLSPGVRVLITVGLPCEGYVEPRDLKCSAFVSQVASSESGLRVTAAIRKMAFVKRASNTEGNTDWSGAEPIRAIWRSRRLSTRGLTRPLN